MLARRQNQFAAAALLAIIVASCQPARTVKYQNAPDGPDPEVAIVAVDTTGGASPAPGELNIDGSIGIAPNAQTMIFGRGGHSAGIATLKLRLIHDNSVVNVATLKQMAPLGAQVENPAMIYASDGIGNAGAMVPFNFKMTDDKYWADIVATDAAGHSRKITVKFVYRQTGGTWIPPGPPRGKITDGDGNTSTDGSSTGGTNQCKCPDPNNAACGGAYGATCTTNSDCRPTMACLVDPAEPHERKFCQQQKLQCNAPTCYKPSDLSYDRTKCPSF